MSLTLLLHQLESARALDRSGGELCKLSMLSQALSDEARNENLRSLLPLIHHLLRSHHLEWGGKLGKSRDSDGWCCAHLIAVETVQQRDTDDGCLDAGVMGERGENCRWKRSKNSTSLFSFRDGFAHLPSQYSRRQTRAASPSSPSCPAQ